MMLITDAPVEEFYPECCSCGEKIDGDGYRVNGDYYCEDCMNGFKVDGYSEAEKRREAWYEEVMSE